LGNLKMARVGMKFEIEKTPSDTKIYRIDKIFEVDPDKFDFINELNEDELVIYTCTGFLDTKRLVVVGKLI
jgi:LPXTG-site transpeptidase (sortase) family protein